MGKSESNRIIERTCEQCGTKFYQKCNFHTIPHYCSIKCFAESRKKQINVKCKYCEKIISVQRNKIRYKHNWGIFCSRRCKGKYASKYISGSNNPQYGKICTSEELQRLRTMNIGKIPWIKGKHHSEKTKRKMRGKNSPHWRGGKSKLKHRIRNSQNYKLWIKQIFERDNYTCQICGIRGTELEVDHYPFTFVEILSKNRIKTMQQARRCKELWDTDNGRTLCQKCHIKTPTYAVFNRQFKF